MLAGRLSWTLLSKLPAIATCRQAEHRPAAPPLSAVLLDGHLWCHEPQFTLHKTRGGVPPGGVLGVHSVFRDARGFSESPRGPGATVRTQEAPGRGWGV